jgi:Family of unknown function (DUF6209)
MSAAKMPKVGENTGAVLSFQTDWRQSQLGPIRQSELLTINYDPQRLPNCRGYHGGIPAWDLFTTLRFSPSGETTSGLLLQHTGRDGVLDPPRAIPFSLRVPADATGAEVWFHNTNVFGCSAFDSQFGQNYHFAVDRAGPAEPVMYRSGAQRSLETVNTFREDITKIRRPLGSAPAAGSQLETRLDLTVWVRNLAYKKNVWIDLHVFDQDDNRVSAVTLTLRYSGPAGGDGDFFALEQQVFLGSGGVPGNVWPRADVRKMQYRLYLEVNDRVFTDGILHQAELPADAAITLPQVATVAA